MTGSHTKNISARGHCAAMVSLLVFLSLLVFVFLTPTRFDRDSYLAACIEKHRLLQAAGSPKIVLVGGSNVATGIDSALLEKRMQRQVVNMGSCIQLGLGFMLREIEDQVRENDLVVVIPEYEHWVDQFNGSKYLLMLPALIPQSVAWITPSYFSPAPSMGRICDDFSSVSRKRARHFLPVKFDSSDPDEKAVLYNHAGFNQRGDFVAHLDMQSSVFDHAQSSMADFSHPDKAALQEFNSIVGRIKSHGARVLLFPPVTTETFARARKEQLDRFYKEMSNVLEAEVVDDYSCYALPDQYFLDCIYHVRKTGRKLRTEQIAADLNKLLQASSTPTHCD